MKNEMITLNGMTYNVIVAIFKDGMMDDGFQIPWSLITKIEQTCSLFEVFDTVSLSFQSKSGYVLERKSGLKSDDRSLDRYDFNCQLDNYVYIRIVPVDVATGVEHYPLINDIFAIEEKRDTDQKKYSNRSSNEIENNTTTLTLIPKIGMDLRNTYPQFTTGHDVLNTAGIIKPPKTTGEAIKDILVENGVSDTDPKNKMDFLTTKDKPGIDQEFFDPGFSGIGFTAMGGSNVIDAIEYLHSCHSSEKNLDTCILKYSSVDHLFSLRSITDYFMYDQTKSERYDGYFDKIWLPSPKVTKSTESNHPVVLNKYNFNVGDPLFETKGNVPMVITSHGRNTFIIDGTPAKLENQTDFIRKNYRGTTSKYSSCISDDLVSDYPKREVFPQLSLNYSISFKKGVRRSFGMGLNLYKKLMSSITFNAELHGLGGWRGVGQQFLVGMSGGAVDEYTRKLLGVYLNVETTRFISGNRYIEKITGVKAMKAAENTCDLNT